MGSVSSRTRGSFTSESDTAGVFSVPGEEKNWFAAKNREGFFRKVGLMLRDWVSSLKKLVNDLWNKILKRFPDRPYDYYKKFASENTQKQLSEVTGYYVRDYEVSTRKKGWELRSVLVKQSMKTINDFLIKVVANRRGESQTAAKALDLLLEMMPIIFEAITNQLEDVDKHHRRYVGNYLIEQLLLLEDLAHDTDVEGAESAGNKKEDIFKHEAMVILLMTVAVLSSHVSKANKQMVINRALDIIDGELNMSQKDVSSHPNQYVKEISEFLDGVCSSFKNMKVDQDIRLLLENEYAVPKGCSDKQFITIFILVTLSKSGILSETHYLKDRSASTEVWELEFLLNKGGDDLVSLIKGFFDDPHFIDNFIPDVAQEVENDRENVIYL